MGEEDRRKYRVAQASQKEAGGAYMVRNGGETAVDMDGYKLASSASLDSVESGASNYGYQAAHNHYGNYNYSQPVSREDSPAITPPGTTPTSTTFQLALPEPAHPRPAPNIRTASSPLARLSLVRTAGPEGASIENLEQTSNSEPPSPPLESEKPSPPSSDSEEREGRPKERKRLRKKSH
jgi:chitin synthase